MICKLIQSNKHIPLHPLGGCNKYKKNISIDLKIPLRSTKEKICKCVISQIIVQVVGLHHLDNHWVMV